MTLDTSGTQCAVAVFDADKQEFFEVVSPLHNKHAESLFSLIDAALADSGCMCADLAHMVAIVGPGSFTGLRASLAVLQGFRLATNIPVHGVNLLELQAYLISKHSSYTDENILSVVDLSYEDMVYYQVFSSTLLPVTNAAIAARNSISEDGYATRSQFKMPDYTNARIAAEYLVHKLSNKLPETPLTPVYSRSYT
ncbi:tRNA (adenosine(37)-N6)-threonylcarbamoyltransferase complex dimerization subunit type 1 TsaB [Anaplasma capra]|uniref:tRNA (adenosine(37)-N6)-threonylcarbamoyltransferase complex dimerization subunit type 1 TsaB n=1 Tax=Anaplasma capra TaxID=1562740 RepID=UPI0021D5F452|nr:tRNA (adenosine(37)-N6)-threonylcarbamoyltransferase complex dimerization subunit type 1 TsaB [Anaplasma capra]MCU7612250.1 tRNA (adenosine(37)-N6)-threonylcarbamoyltransferase complex dimerization subunit type 1 TsaB [Anaplasma capra]